MGNTNKHFGIPWTMVPSRHTGWSIKNKWGNLVADILSKSEAEFMLSAIAQQDAIAASLRDAVRYIERKTAHNGAMDAKTLEAEEKHVRKYVSEVSTGRWAGDLVRFDLAQARELLATLETSQPQPK